MNGPLRINKPINLPFQPIQRALAVAYNDEI